MKERPISFSAPMVRALLAGTKTQTRRVVKPQPAIEEGFPVEVHDSGLSQSVRGGLYSFPLRNPYGVSGDRLWVRETWSHTGQGVWSIHAARVAGRGGVVYAADGGNVGGWFLSIHMPREFSRITLEVTGVRVERLQDISEADAKAEGSQEPTLVPIIGACWSERDAYAKLWESINGPGSWDANPWVWVVEFKRVAS